MKARYAAFAAFAVAASAIVIGGAAAIATGLTERPTKGMATVVHPVSPQPTSTVPASPASTTDTVAEIGDEGFTYDNELQVQVLSARRFQPADTAVGIRQGQIGVKVQIRMTNGSGTAIDLSRTRVRLTFGTPGVPAERLLDAKANLTDFDGEVAPGRSATATFGFAVDPVGAGQLAIEVRPGYEYDISQFTGTAS